MTFLPTWQIRLSGAKLCMIPRPRPQVDDDDNDDNDGGDDDVKLIRLRTSERSFNMRR